MSQSGTGRNHDAAAGPSTERGERLCDRVYTLHEPEGQPEVEMVFIHGLIQLGDSKDAYKDAYWTAWLTRDGSQDNCWPMTWLADRFPKARVLSISYDARLQLESSSSRTMDLIPLGESLVQEMVLSEARIGQNGCPVVFVCHCLGGLIAKQIIVLAHERFKGDQRIEKLLRNTTAFVFYATPHGGSELVKLNHEIGRLNSAFEAIQRKVYNNKWRFRVVAERHATSSNCWPMTWLLNWFSSSMIVQEPSVRHVGYDYVMHVAADHFDVCRPESERDTSFLYLTGCIEEVVAEYKSCQANMLDLPSLVVGDDEKLVELREKLNAKPVVGLVGMGGVGKTTLSKRFYNSEREPYERCSYLEDVKSHSDMVGFQRQLLRELCDEKWNDTEDPKVYLRKVKQCIQTKKVLVVIDDVGTEQNLKALHVLAFEKGSSGSRLVVTCRNRAVLLDYTTEGGIIEVEALAHEPAMELFRHYAFHKFDDDHKIRREGREEFENEAVNIVTACGGLPLSIEVVGQHLRKQSRFPGKERMGMWKEALRRLKEAQALGGCKNEDERLWRQLRISYDELAVLEQGLFLDFACILCDMEVVDMSTVIRIWGDAGGLQTLIDSSLLKVAKKRLTRSYYDSSNVLEIPELSSSRVKELVMHDQLRDMGRWIVRELGKDHVQRHRIHMWEKGEIQRFVEDNEDSRMLEGLSWVDELKYEYAEGMHSRIYLSEALVSEISEAFENKKLESEHIQRFPMLRLINFSYNEDDVVNYVFKIFSFNRWNLRWLCLNGTMITRSHLEILGANFKELRVLHVRECLYVVELPSSIGELSSLRELDLRGCRPLVTLPDAIGKLGNLQVLILRDCIKLKELPESMGSLVQLEELDLSLCYSLKSLPSTIGKLKLLKLLSLRGCQRVETIPAGVGGLMKLESLDLSFCLSLHTMCEFESEMHYLHFLDLRRCYKLESLKSLGNLYCLRTLKLAQCGRLRIPKFAECVGQLHQLQVLDLEGCDRMKAEIAESLREGHVPTDVLEVLCLSCFPEVALPPCPQLKFLLLSGCMDGESVAWGSRWLQNELPKAFGESLGMLVQLQVLHMDRIPSVPECVGNLAQLRELCVRKSSCERLQEHVGNLLSLRKLSVEECHILVELPSSLGRLSQLRTLTLSKNRRLKRLPESLGGLTQLRELRLADCSELECLPDSIGGLTQLRTLDLSYCEKFECLPDSFVGLTQLSMLLLNRCSMLEWKEKEVSFVRALEGRGCRCVCTLPTC